VFEKKAGEYAVNKIVLHELDVLKLNLHLYSIKCRFNTNGTYHGLTWASTPA